MLVEAAGFLETSVQRSLENTAIFKSCHCVCNKTHSYGINPRDLSSLSDLSEGTRNGMHACFSFQWFRAPPVYWLYVFSFLFLIDTKIILDINVAFFRDGTLCTLLCMSTSHCKVVSTSLTNYTNVRNICLLQLQIWKMGGHQSSSKGWGIRVFTPPGNKLQWSDRPGRSLVALLTQIRRVIKQ